MARCLPLGTVVSVTGVDPFFADTFDVTGKCLDSTGCHVVIGRQCDSGLDFFGTLTFVFGRIEQEVKKTSGL